jgi:hypothetical protein
MKHRSGVAGFWLALAARAAACGLIAAFLPLDFGLANAGAVQLRGNVSSSLSSLHLTRRAPADKPLDLRIYFALRDRATLDKLLADQQDRNSPEYHRWLTPDEFAARFGPTETDFSAVTGWLHSEGLNIVSADIKSREIRYGDTVSHAEQMFGVHIFGTEDGRLFGNREEPSLPERFDGVIAFIDGLDNLRAVMPASHLSRDLPDRSTGLQSPPPLELAMLLSRGISASLDSRPDFQEGNAGPGFGPADVRTFYDAAPLIKAGIDGSRSDCIALLELSNFDAQAVSTFNQTFSLPNPVFTTVLADGSDPGVLEGELGEESALDVELAHGAAPGAPLAVYIGDPNTVGPATATADAGQRILNDNLCGVISVCLGSCGAPENSFPGVAGAQGAQAASQGMSVFVASGDFGASGMTGGPNAFSCNPSGVRGVNELAASPNVTAVGGTVSTVKFDKSGNVDGYAPEQAWPESGGGASGAYPKPAYQQGVTPNDGARDLPDIAALAAGYFYDFGEFSCCQGGTSAATPTWAAFVTLIAQISGGRLGNINPQLYQLGPLEDKSKVGLHDITVGNNSYLPDKVKGFNAGPLYDQATGWGSPDVAILAKTLLAVPTAQATPMPQLTPTGTPGAATPSPSPAQTSASGPTPTTTPVVIQGADQLSWGSTDDVENDDVNPPGINGAEGPDTFIIKASNQNVIFSRPPYGEGFAAKRIDDYSFITPVGAVAVPPAASNNPPVSNQSRIYYDPDGPSAPGCTPGGRYLFVALSTAGAKATLDSKGRRPSLGTRGVLIASSPGSDPTADPSTWYKVFLPADCTGKLGCADSPQLGWNSANIAVALNNYYLTGKWHPGLLTVSHDALECGQVSSQTALAFKAFANDPSVTKTAEPGWDTALQSACVAPGYSSSVGSDFQSGSLYLINVPGNSTSSVEISALTAAGDFLPNYVPVQKATPWASVPATVTQNGIVGDLKPLPVKVFPADSRFTSCMYRNGAIWASHMIGVGKSGLAAQWWEIGLSDGLTAGKLYVQDQIGGQSTGPNIANPSIAANSNCPAYGGSGPTCDVMVGFSSIPPASTSGYMSGGFVLTPNNGSQGPVSLYTPGIGPYENCTGKSPASLQTSGLSATTIDPQNYPGDTNFFTTADCAGSPIGLACKGAQWNDGWALISLPQD